MVIVQFLVINLKKLAKLFRSKTFNNQSSTDKFVQKQKVM
jgi:hypothetical protein